MNRTQKRAERIKAEIPIDQLLADYGYNIYVDGEREQQFSCDLHGDGTDSKPSARVYPESNQWYCFACTVSRDSIQTVREKEGVGFIEAIDLLERKFKLPSLPWEDAFEETSPEELFAESLREPSRDTLEIETTRAKRLLEALTTERTKPLPLMLRLWEQFDCLSVMSTTNPDAVHSAMSKLVRRLIEESGSQS